MFDLQPLRHTSTLPKALIQQGRLSRAGSATVDDIDHSCGPRSARLRRRRVQYSPITRAFHSIRSNAPRNALAHSILQDDTGHYREYGRTADPYGELR
jgi:hypothetical protein